MVHDLSEVATGDVPAPVKWANPELKSALNRITVAWELERGLRVRLSEPEAQLLSWADMLEFALYAIEEVTLGNRFFKPMLGNAVSNLADRPVPSLCPHAGELLRSVLAEATRITRSDYS